MKVKVKVTQSGPTLCDPTGYRVHGMDSPDQNTGVGSLSLLQGIFPTQGSNYTVKGFSIVDGTEVDVLLEFSCFLCASANVGL